MGRPDVNALIADWWASRGSTSLDQLTAKIAAAWGDPKGYVRCSVIDDGVNPPTMSLDIEDKNGLTTTTWQPPDQTKALEDVVVPALCATVRRKRELVAVAALADVALDLGKGG